MSGAKEALRSELAALREELAALRLELAAARAQDAHHCHGCHCQAVWVYPYTPPVPATPWYVSPVTCGTSVSTAQVLGSVTTN